MPRWADRAVAAYAAERSAMARTRSGPSWKRMIAAAAGVLPRLFAGIDHQGVVAFRAQAIIRPALAAEIVGQVVVVAP